MDCAELPEMVFIEDILASLGGMEKALALVKSKLPIGLIKKLCGKSDLKSPVILFTSGSEKDPKVVQLTQQNLLSNINSFPTYGCPQHGQSAGVAFFHVFGLTIISGHLCALHDFDCLCQSTRFQNHCPNNQRT